MNDGHPYCLTPRMYALVVIDLNAPTISPNIKHFMVGASLVGALNTVDVDDFNMDNVDEFGHPQGMPLRWMVVDGIGHPQGMPLPWMVVDGFE